MRNRFSKMLAIVMTVVLCMTMVTPAYAFPSGGSTGSSRGMSSFWSKLTEWFSSQEEDETTEESESSGSVTTLSLVEDDSTVDNSDITLRASTYEATTVETDEDGGTTTETATVKYFPVTLFDYDQDTYNAAVAALEETDGSYTGIYMSNSDYATADYNRWTGYLTADSVAVYGNQIYQGLVENTLDASGNIVFNHLDAGLFTTTAVSGKTVYTNVGLPFVYDSTTRQYSFNAKEMGAWFDGEASSDVNLVYSATPQGISGSTAEDDSPTGWFPFNDSSDTEATTESVTTGDWSSGDDISNNDAMTSATTWTVTKTNNGYTFSTTSGGTTYYLTIATSDGGAATLSTSRSTVTVNTYDDDYIDIGRTGTSGGGQGQGPSSTTYYYLNQYGGADYNEYKSYTAAGSSDDGAKFYLYQQNEDGTWSAINPSSLTSLDNDGFLSNIKIVSYRGQVLTSTTSSTTGTSVADTTDYTFKAVSVYDIDYYFGMTASIDFTMTEDGKITYTDENGNEVSEDIVFHFSGDDDVWVFIDGVLVLDMGGIHNRIDGDIDFSSGTWSITQTYGSTTGELAVDYATGNTNGSSGNLWNTGNSTGTLDTTLSTFAAQETHTLTVYYMERGAGASNCEITFNLPMKDYVTVTKEANTDSEETALTESEQEVVDNMEFTFTIYKDKEAYANQTYTVLNAASGNTIRTASTDAYGQFTIHPGETARFTTMFSENSETWYVVESDPGSAFSETVWSTSDSAVYDVTKTTSSDGLTSDTLTVKGSAEASSTINFVCKNILDATLANPGIVPSDDRIVIDYGLPVEIDVKSNDLYRADNYRIVGINNEAMNGTFTFDSEGNVTAYKENSGSDNLKTEFTGTYGTITVTDDENGQLTYQLTSQLTDVEVINYIVEVSSTVVKNEATGEKDTATAYAMATVYVIPATSMYYEENFLNADGKTMITYSTGNWETVGAAETDPQEPGVVGTVGDSPYGSDVAYLADTGDSNGSSMYVNTTSSSASFSYTFTGTGTSFFARTTNNSGYMRVTIYDADGKQVRQELIDTRYLNDGDETLFNIPVFTWDAVDDDLGYGTYTVKVALAKSTEKVKYGTDFWLDGIRVQNPMNENSTNYFIAQSAYSADGEANVNIETLRDKVKDAATEDENGDLTWDEGYAVLTDVNKNIVSASDYVSIGPKEEVYLAGTDYSGETNAQTISFSLEEWDMNYSLYLGLKNPTGKGATITINGHKLTISNTADCYYDISDYLTVDSTNDDGSVNVSVTITCTAGLVSITNIKTTGTLKFAIIKNTGKSVDGYEDSDDNEDVDVYVDIDGDEEDIYIENSDQEASEETPAVD